MASHKHVIGTTGVGKSKFLESMFLQYLHQRVGITFIDPNGDSCEAILAQLLLEGFFEDPSSYRKLLYIEFSERDFFLPFNVLSQPKLATDVAAQNVLEAFHRCWPALDDGAAPRFDNLMLAGMSVLIDNQLPLTAMHNLLSDRDYRDDLLSHTKDLDVVSFFLYRFNEWKKDEAPQMIESTLTRIFLMTFSPALKFTLGQTDNILNFREIMDQGTCVLFNLSRVQNLEAQRFLGCLLSSGYESAAISRSDILPHLRRQHHLLLDEFANYSAQSERALTTMLSQCRKFELFLTLAHQTWDQASSKLKGSLQNARVKVSFQLGAEDARIFAHSLGQVDPKRTKEEEAKDLFGQEVLDAHTMKAFMELQAQWQEWEQTLQTLPIGQALIKIGIKPTVQIKTKVYLPKLKDYHEVEKVKREYRLRLMRPVEQIELVHQNTQLFTRTVSRAVPLQS
jgi:hypothetical protein